MFITILSVIALILGLGILEMLFLKGVTTNRLIFTSKTGALIKLGVILNDIRGSIGNYTYSIQKAGVHTLRSKAASISNPQSIEQQKVRCNFAVNVAAWKGLTPAQQADWETWAQTKPGMGSRDGGIRNLIKGNNGIMSGFNAFCLANQWLVSADLAAVTAAPLGVSSPGSPSQVAATYAANTITVTWVDPAEIVAGDKIRVWLVNRNGTIHKQLHGIVADAIQTLAIVNVQSAGGLTVPVADYPGDYLIQLDCVAQTGVKGGPSNTAEVTVS